MPPFLALTLPFLCLLLCLQAFYSLFRLAHKPSAEWISAARDELRTRGAALGPVKVEGPEGARWTAQVQALDSAASWLEAVAKL